LDFGGGKSLKASQKIMVNLSRYRFEGGNLPGYRKQTLKDILSALPVDYHLSGDLSDAQVTGVTSDSRQVKPANIFVALTGGEVDGHQFIPSAIKNGAGMAVGSEDISGLPIPYLKVKNPREALAFLAAAFFEFPANQLTVIGVTGTDGKTTTSNLIFQILIHAGFPAGIISTVSAKIGDEEVDTGFHVTTPESPDVQRYLARMLTAGLTHVILEATSHGLAQHRVTACAFDIGVVTNITHEHLDYHGSYENYRAAKTRLFEELQRTPAKAQGNPRLAILNYDDQSYDFLNKTISGAKIKYSLSVGADLWAEDICYDHSGLHFTAVSPSFRQQVDSCLAGYYNVSNILAAMSAAIYGCGVDPETAAQGIQELKGIPGRMERIDMGQKFIAVVDFAHTPNALEKSLSAGRQMTDSRVIAVFGSAGLRDREKRRLMAETSAELADITIITAEDPRTEDLDGILKEMAAAAVKSGAVEGQTVFKVADRGEAIHQAVEMARAGDIVLACGKGHEQSMCFGTKEYPWDDRTAMRAALADLTGQAGPQMPYLPTQS
jgi:UDP-N-acetylmuramoyl-L-alanyl-D-glutamate--2,6-diaminopimelate ligase